MAEHETIADIIAEVRDKYTVHECNQCAWRKCCSEGFGSEKCGKFRESIFLKLGIEDGFFTQLLDRLEAAHRRERGNAAELREALRECAQYIVCVGGIGVGEVTINDEVRLMPEELAQKAITALDATEKEGGEK